MSSAVDMAHMQMESVGASEADFEETGLQGFYRIVNHRTLDLGFVDIGLGSVDSFGRWQPDTERIMEARNLTSEVFRERE